MCYVHASTRGAEWLLQGCSATICMPPTTTPLKIDSVRRLGAEIELVGATYAEAQVHAQMRAAAEGKVSLNPLNPTLAQPKSLCRLLAACVEFGSAPRSKHGRCRRCGALHGRMPGS